MLEGVINEYHQAAYMLQRNVIPAIPPRDRANFQEDALPELIPTGCVLGTIQSVDMYDLRRPDAGARRYESSRPQHNRSQPANTLAVVDRTQPGWFRQDRRSMSIICLPWRRR